MVDFLLSPPSRPPYPGCKFLPPPIDGSLTIPEMYDWHLEKNPDHPVFAFTGASGVQELTMSQVVPATHRAARLVAREAADIDLTGNSRNPLVAIISSTDNVTQLTIILGLLRAGIPCFPINHMIPDAYIEHLIISCQPQIIYTSHEARIENAIHSAIKKIKLSADSYNPKILSVPLYTDIYGKEHDFNLLPTRKYDYSSPVIISASSGSTSLPKSVVRTARSQLQTGISPLFSDHNLCGKRLGSYSASMNGLFISFVTWVATTGVVLTTFAPGSLAPSVEEDPEAYFRGFVDCKVSYIVESPRKIETWSRDPVKVEFLATLDGVMPGGDAINKWTGDYLSQKGVKLLALSGMTEVGTTSFASKSLGGNEWEYFTFNPHCAAELIPQRDGLFELIIVSRPTQDIAVACNTVFRREKAFASGDLLAPHPEKPNYWKFVGRKNDQINLANGTKLNPRLFEDFFRFQPEVKGAMMFGHNKPCIGMLVEFKSTSTIDTKTVEQVNRFIERIWPTINKINESVPKSSRLEQEMIIPASLSMPFDYTGKGNPRRPVILQLYKTTIDLLYNGRK